MFLSFFNFLKTIIAIIDLIILSLVLYLIALIPQTHNTVWFKSCFRYWTWVFIRALGVSLFPHQHHRQALPKQYILIGNHPSAFEDLGMPALFNVRFLAKQEVRNWFIVGQIGAAAGTLYVKREERESRQAANQALETVLEQGDSVGLYPEGGCKGRRVWFPFLFGAFNLSIKTGVPILPVFLHYEAQEIFEWQSQTLLKKLWQILRSRNKRANYHIFDPIDPKNFKTVEEYCQYVQSLYAKWQSQFLE
jgi:1-acyl-sn-glycerol-3-phosphate acyltransferase